MTYGTEPVARRTDPETSHAAAASIRDVRKRQADVWHMLHALGAMTDEQLVDAFTSDWATHVAQSPSGVRTRRSELARVGLVVATGDLRATRSGRMAKVWRAVVQ